MIRIQGQFNTAICFTPQLEPEAEKETEEIKKMSKELPLSNDKKFQELYMEYMYFE